MANHQMNLQALNTILGRLDTSIEAHWGVTQHILRVKDPVSALMKVRDNPDPMKSVLAQNKDIDAAKAKLSRTVSESRKGATEAIGVLKTKMTDIQMRGANLVPNEYAAEIRTIFRGLDLGGKTQFLGEAIERGDGPTIAAITQAPVSVTGLNPTMVSQFRQAALSKLSSVDMAPIETLAEVATATFQACDAILAD